MTDMNLNQAKVVEIHPLDSKWIKLDKIRYLDPTGTVREWETASRATRVKDAEIDGVGVVALLEKPTGKEILLQKQYRPPVDGVCIEIPAGLLDPNESIGRCAERELLEETGYVGHAIKVSPVMFNDPGFCNTNLRLVYVSVDLTDPRNQNPKPQLEDGEFIETFSVPLAKLPQSLRELAEQGYFLDARIQNIADGIELALTALQD